jgi:hypothetical protein
MERERERAAGRERDGEMKRWRKRERASESALNQRSETVEHRSAVWNGARI